MRVVVATRNRHKVVEIAALLAEARLGFELVALEDVAPGLELIEDEETFEGNALAKARQASAATGLPSLADDSGLEVDALEGAPGVRSARYAGEPCDDVRNNEKLLAALDTVPDHLRTGRFRCAAAFVDPSRGLAEVRDGACEGTLLRENRGDGGFGYDPLFWIAKLGKSMAELSLDEKNAISHRAKAFGALASVLRSRAP